MSVLAISANRFLPTYIPGTDPAVSQAAERLRDRFREIPATSWVQQERTRGEEAVDAAVTSARTHGGTVSERTIQLAKLLIRALPPHVPDPDILVEDDGEIAFDWNEHADRGFTITVNENGFIAYSGLTGLKSDYGRSPFSGSVPEAVVLNLLRVYPLPSAPGRR